MPTPVAIILILAFIFLMGYLVNIFNSFNPIIIVPLVLIIFLTGWFVVWGIASKDANQTIREGAKEGIKGLLHWGKHMLIMIGMALLILIFAGFGRF